MQLKKWLLKPYPLLEKTTDKLILISSFALFTYIFLVAYEPFQITEIKENKKVYLLGFGFCVFLGLFINYFLLPKLLPNTFRSENWIIKKEILYVFWSFMLISIFNYGYNTLVGKDIALYRNWFEFFGITFSVGIFPLLGLIYFIERRQNKRNTIQAAELSQKREQEQTNFQSDTAVSIQSDTAKQKAIVLNSESFVFATSDNNYTTIFYIGEDGSLKKTLLRLSITNLEQQLAVLKSVIRCHRSYLVNKQKIKSIQGNARSLTILINNYDGIIPVSRSFPKEKLI